MTCGGNNIRATLREFIRGKKLPEKATNNR